MKKLKLFFAALALLVGVSSVMAQPTASTPVVGNTYYLYNPITKLFMTTNVDLPFVRPTGSAWKLEAAAGHEGWITLRLKDNGTDGCGYFWGKWWANNPAENSAGYADERVYQLVNISGSNYKLKSYAWGENNAYIYINKGNEGDRSYRLACNSHEQGGLDEGYVTWQFISEEDYATYMSMDYTSYIKNNDFIDGTSNWTLDGTGNKQAHGNTAIEYWKSSAASGSFDFYQDLTSLPAGKYVLRAAMYNSTDGEAGASFAAPGQCGVYGTSNNVTKNANVSVDGTAYNIYTTEELLVPDGNLRLGFKNSATMTARWFGVDWIQLTCEDYCISYTATELPANGEIEAGKWYKYPVAVTGSYTISATTPANIIQTTNGSQLLKEATGSEITIGDDVELTEGDVIYYKSSSANKLTIEANIKTYSVGDATANASYVQKDNIVTISWNDATTNDGSASFAKNGTPTITFNGNAVDIETTAKGFSFTVPSGLTANTEYTLAIPANAFGYAAGSTYNEAQNITLKTPAVFDGVYYLYDATNKVFLSRGANFGARATVDKYGIPFTWNNYSKTIVFKDWTSNELFFDKADHSNCWLYTDGSLSNANGTFSFEAADGEGGLYLRDYPKTVYVKHDGSVIDVPTASTDNAIVWKIKTKAEHDAIVNAYPTENKTNVIAAASLTSETDAAGFESWLAANRAAKDKTSSVGTAKFTGEAGDWTWTKNPNGANDATYGTDWTEAYERAVGTWSQTITGLQKGVYKVTVNAFERAAGYATCNTLGAAGWEPVTAYFMANDEQIQLKSWYSEKEGTNNPNTTGEAATAFNNDKYKNQLYTYVGDDGNLTITIGKPGKADGSWVLFNNVTLTYYDSNVSDEDATAILSEASTAMDSPMKHSLYAALSTAKETFDGSHTVPNYNALRTAIDNTATSIASYANMNTNYLSPLATYFETTNFVDQTSDAYTTYLGYKNAYENYKDAETADIENATANALNWKSGDRYVTPINGIMMVSWKIGDTDALTNNSGFYMNTWSTESAGEGDAKDFANPFFEYWVGSGSLAANTLTGTLTGLSENTIYKVTANVRIQGTNEKVAKSITMQVGDGAETDVTDGSKIGETDRYIGSYSAVGMTDGDGKLTLTFNVAASSNISWLAFRDINYEAAPATVTATLGTNGFTTFASPYALDLTSATQSANGFAAYRASAVNDETVTFKDDVDQAVEPNTGILLKGTANATVTIPVVASGTILEDNALQVNVAGTTFSAAENTTYYGMNKNSDPLTFGTFDPSSVAIPANKAYLTITTGGAARSIRGVFGDITGVANVEAVEAVQKDGKFFKNGKLFIMKNGKKYNATGAQVK